MNAPKPGWKHVRDRDEIHVVPVDDAHEHFCDELLCWCDPQRDAEDPLVITHRAKDGRR